MPKLNATQRNYLYLVEASRTGIHKPILAALYAVHNSPVLADGERGLGLLAANSIRTTDLDTFMEQIQFAANTIRSLADKILAEGGTGDDIWDRSLRRYGDRFIQVIAQGYTPPSNNTIAAKLNPADFNSLLNAYINDIGLTFDGSRVAQNLAFLDKPLIELAQRIPTYYNGSEAHRQAGLETVRLWRRLNTRDEAIRSLATNGSTLLSAPEIDARLKQFFQTLSPFYGGLAHQREALLRLTQLWRRLDTRDAAIASLEDTTDPEANVNIVDPALLVFAQNVSLFFQSKLDQRLAVLEGVRVWRGLNSRNTVLSQLGVDPRVFENNALPPDTQLRMLRALDQGLVDFTKRVPDAYQETNQQREALIRMFQIWRRLRSRQATLEALFDELEKIPSSPPPEEDNPGDDGEIFLSPNFTLREMTRSDTGDRLGLPNIPTPAEIENLRKLCNQILQPARNALGPLFITSGFRSAAVNNVVGGVPNSDHRLGYAADVVPVNGDTLRFAQWVRDNVPFDQVILEGGTAQRPSWIHVSANPRNRRQYFRVANP